MANLTEYEKKPLGERILRSISIEKRRLAVAIRTPSRVITWLFIVGVWVALGLPIYEKSIARGVFHTVFALVLVMAKARMLAGKNLMQLVSRQYLERKIGLYLLIKQMQRRDALSLDEIFAYQRQALELIASYVRGHRADVGGTKVYVNLIVLVDGDLVVISRNDPTRMVGARYPKSSMWLSRVFDSGDSDATGDVAADFPESAGKPYKSILGVPLLVKDKVRAVVSIDSRNKFEFDGEVEHLTRALAPYVALLEWTLNTPLIEASLPTATPGTNLPGP